MKPWVSLSESRKSKLTVFRRRSSLAYLLCIAITTLAASPINLHIVRIEAVQTVQDQSDSVPLVNGKPTLVRVYIASNSKVAELVSGDLKVSSDGVETLIKPLGAVEVTSKVASLRQLREDVRSSLNFLIPGDLIQSSSATLEVVNLVSASTKKPAKLGCSPCSSSVVARFADRPTLRVRLVGIRYKDGTSRYVANGVDFELIASWLKRVYPTGKVDVSQCVVDTDETWPFDCTIANTIVANVRTSELAYQGPISTSASTQVCGLPSRSSADLAHTHYYGVLSDGGAFERFMRGCANTIPGHTDYSAIASGPAGNPQLYDEFLWDTDGSYGDWYAGHEIGHLFGRKHPGMCGSTRDDTSYPFDSGRISGNDGGVVGVDVGYPGRNIGLSILPGTLWSDTMDYCDHVWQSAYTYEAIGMSLEAEHAGPSRDSQAGPGPAKASDPVGASSQPQDGNFLNVIGTVDAATGVQLTGQIRYANPIKRGIPSLPPDVPEASLRVLDNKATVIQTVPISLLWNASSDRKRAMFNATFSLTPDSREVWLFVGNTALDHRFIGPTPPIVTDFSATLQRGSPVDVLGRGREDSNISLQWKGTDSDNDMIAYDVQLSKDAGANWASIAPGLHVDSIQIDPSTIQSTDDVMFRIRASDGLQTGVSEVRRLSSGVGDTQLRDHVQWAIYHEGCDLFLGSAGGKVDPERFQPVAELRKCFLSKQTHNPDASKLIKNATDAELNDICIEAAREIPLKYELFANFEWVARHEGELASFRQLRISGDYPQIRSKYIKAQTHNPNAVNLLSAVSDAKIQQMVDSLKDIKPRRLGVIE